MIFDKTFRNGVREFLWSGFLLVSALMLAIFSSVARRNGLGMAASTLSFLALVLAALVSYTVIPRLLKRVRLEYWMVFRFFRVTRRGGFFAFLLLLIGASTFNTGNNLLVLVLSFLLAALLVSGMVSNIVLYGLEVGLTLPEAIHAGQTAGLLLSLKNLKRRCPSFALRVKSYGEVRGDANSSDFFAQERRIPFVEAGSVATVRMESAFRRRGVFDIQGFEIRTEFPFGFFVRGRAAEVEGRIVVYPALVDVQHFVTHHPAFQGVELRDRKGQGGGLYNVRDYQWGDDSRYVHWKSSAKLSRLMVKEFFHEADLSVDLVLSTYLPRRAEREVEQFEKGLSYFASLMRHYRLGGRTLRVYTGELDLEVNGRDQAYERVMEYLATVVPATGLLLDPARVRKPAIVFAAGELSIFRGFSQIDYLQL